MGPLSEPSQQKVGASRGTCRQALALLAALKGLDLISFRGASFRVLRPMGGQAQQGYEEHLRCRRR